MSLAKNCRVENGVVPHWRRTAQRHVSLTLQTGKNKQPLTHASGRSFVELGFSDSVLGLSAHGTVLTAGSLQGPLLLSAPTARTRTHIFVPLFLYAEGP